MVLIIKNTFSEFTVDVLKKTKIYAITTTNVNEYTIPLLTPANVTFGLVSITDESNSSGAVAVSIEVFGNSFPEEVVIWL